ncbi:type IV pilus biogenesis/stability protein PilW [Agarivorans sp. TSD2052]|uniref:type IV pilus biogenesis/stability protein PilW n=1 Tax=Agarivorans sp. TSD2052 TaxID=2937286 RepID=UPI00200BFE41|nr:type IV pilus biogenesis/stability protein PilW [Agarivorans sp. TSD2052]UPW17190.1 type IV pilus biogenesis/stability protein PilW [Agarivorans sp. TSD2052]
MKRWLYLFLVVLSVTGCVTETRVNGQEVNNKDKQLDKDAAAKTRISLALRYLEAGDAEQAKRNLELSQELAPNLVDVYIAQAHFYQQVRQPDRALDAYKKAKSIAPNNGDVLNNYGVMLCKQKHYDEADALFNQALANPEYVQVAGTNENAGLCALTAGHLDKALEYFSSALAYNIRRPASLLGASEVYLQQNKPEQARLYLQRYDSMSETTAKSAFAWIRVESAADNFAEEARWGLTLQQQFPKSEETKRYMANDY